jgi:adenosylmethionine---8-amino-7-oxononanoate aminotransferase
MTTAERDLQFLWHPFTPQLEWEREGPLVIERGDGNYLISEAGDRYLDGVSSLWVTVHGHRCEAIDGAIRDQLDRLAHSTLLGLTHPPAVELAERLVGIAPRGLTRVFYSDSGSTAVEIALKQAFQYWALVGRPERRHFVHLAEAYHGDTLGAVGVGGIDLFHRIFGPLIVAGIPAPTPGTYPNPDRLSPDQIRDRALAAMRAILAERGHEIAAVIVEPLIQGAAGMITHAPGYLRGVAELCREHDVLLIVDEVATGFGRTGTMFACEQEGVKPDLLCLAKGITGGYLPLAATLSTERIYKAFLAERREYKTFFHGHTYTGNPLACAAALASLDLFETNQVLAHVRRMEQVLARLLAERIAPLPVVADIRQRGMMIGIELGDPRTGGMFPVEQYRGVATCRAVRKHGVILRPLGDVIVWMPPLSLTEGDAELLADATRKAILEACEDALSS